LCSLEKAPWRGGEFAESDPGKKVYIKTIFLNPPPCSFRIVPEAVWQFSALLSAGTVILCNHSWNRLFHLLP